MKGKLRDERGETLIEVLASILICTLSVSMLFGAVMASSHMDLQAQDLDEQYYQDVTKAEGQTAGDVYAPPDGAKVIVGIANMTAPNKEVGVQFYGTERLLSYAIPSAPAAGGGGT